MSILRAVHLVRNHGYSRFLSSASAPDTRSPALVDILKRSRAAQLEYSSFTQKQIDKIFFDTALAGNGARLPLAEMAVAETKKGVVEDKVIKNHFATEATYNRFANAKSCGVISADDGGGIERIAFPLGIVGVVAPVTNPTSTVMYKCLMALKTRNSVVIAPHPSAAKCSAEAARIICEAAVRAGAPKDIVQCLEKPSLQLTQELMNSPEINLIWATGGHKLVHEALKTGKPTIVAGEGNCAAIIDDEADIEMAVSSVITSKVFDNGMTCATEQAVVLVDSIKEAALDEFRRRGCYVLSPQEAEAVGKVLLEDDFSGVNKLVAGQSVERIAELANVQIPPGTKVLMGVSSPDKIGPNFAWSHEKLCPVLGVFTAPDYKGAIDVARTLTLNGGVGHTGSYFTNEKNVERLRYFEEKVPAGTLVHNEPSLFGSIGDVFNPRTVPRLSIPSSTNIGESAVGLERLLAIKVLNRRHEHMLWMRVPGAMYYGEDCMSEAIKHVRGTRALIVTDSPLVRLGFVDKLADQIRARGMSVEIFDSVEPDPTIETARLGVQRMNQYKPDVVFAFGGGSPIDCAKIMKLLYLHPDMTFEQARVVFMDITKRTMKFPSASVDAYQLPLVAVPTTSGTGAEITPFAVIRDGKTGKKYPLADYCMTPQVAIIDPSYTYSMPKTLAAYTGFDALTHAIEAYVSVLASDFTKPLSLRAIKMLGKDLVKSFEVGDHASRRSVHYASTLAGYAIGNSFVGIAHSLAHQLGGRYDIPHGVACGLTLPEVILYNSVDAPTRQAVFPQYTHPCAKEAYAEIADELGLSGNTLEEKVKALHDKIVEIRARLKMPATLQETGKVPLADFEAQSYVIAREAFDDQCTLSNPRYPLIKELEALLHNMYHGPSK